MVQAPSGESTRTGNTSPACVAERPATMRVSKGYVYIQYRDWNHHLLHYRGKVSAAGWVDAYHTNRDGSRSILSGQFTNGVLSANMERGPCDYTATFSKA
jgi:hypothetical protein